MLVKFLSYIATMIGTKRYKPVVFSGLAIAISLIGVVSVWSVYEPSHGTAASTVSRAEDPTKDVLSSDPSLSKRSTREDTTAQQPSPAGQAAVTTPSAAPSTSTPLPATTIQTTSDGTLTVKKGSTSALLTFSTADTSPVQWSVSGDFTAGPTVITPDGSGAASASFSFSLKAEQINGGTYTFTVHAKDSTRSLDLTKTLIVTVPKE